MKQRFRDYSFYFDKIPYISRGDVKRAFQDYIDNEWVKEWHPTVQPKNEPTKAEL